MLGIIPMHALHNKNNENSIIPNRQIEQGDKQHCVIEDGFVYDNLSTISMALVLADINNLPSQLAYVDNNLFLGYRVPGDGNFVFHSLSLLINGNTTTSFFYRNIICTHIIHNWQIWEDQLLHSHTNNMTVELYQQHMINRNGWPTATEIQAAANLFGLSIHILLQQYSRCTLSSFNASYPTCIDILLSRNHFSTLKRVPPNTDSSFDILKNQLKRQGQQNKTSNNKKENCQPKLHHI
jgi:hypothetical protein